MDIVAHGLWAGIGVALARRRWPIAPHTAAAAVALAARARAPAGAWLSALVATSPPHAIAHCVLRT